VQGKQRHSKRKPTSGGASKRIPLREFAEEIPETDFSRGIQPHRYARLRGDYKYTVFLEVELREHFGSAEAVKAALRALVRASKHMRAVS
jgi:hypothetical protein